MNYSIEFIQWFQSSCISIKWFNVKSATGKCAVSTWSMICAANLLTDSGVARQDVGAFDHGRVGRCVCLDLENASPLGEMRSVFLVLSTALRQTVQSLGCYLANSTSQRHSSGVYLHTHPFTYTIINKLYILLCDNCNTEYWRCVCRIWAALLCFPRVKQLNRINYSANLCFNK